jgi:hypothetical protein
MKLSVCEFCGTGAERALRKFCPYFLHFFPDLNKIVYQVFTKVFEWEFS